MGASKFRRTCTATLTPLEPRQLFAAPVAVNDTFTTAAGTTLKIVAPTAETSLLLDSEPGEFIAGGKDRFFAASAGTFTANGDPYWVSVSFFSKGFGETSFESWFTDFAAPHGKPLVPGTYLDAQRAGFMESGHPGLSISGNSNGSNSLSGKFTVKQYVNDNGTVLRFAADFEQHSESQTPALRGTIKYNYLKPAGVLANDTDADGNTLKAKLVAAPLHGTLALNTDGTFTYAPIAGFNGTDTFTYKANDGATDSNTATVTIKVGSTTTTGSIAGNLYNDLDADAIKDTGEVNLSGWKVFLDADKDGLLDTGEKTATADNSGNYKFTGLAAGTYRVRETLNSGWRRTTPSSGYHDLTLASGQNVTGKNFGNTQQILISGSVFKDLDGDGIKDAGESALSSWRVFVDADKDGVFDAGEKSTLSDSSGNYKFNLPAGTYRVREVLQSTWRRTTPTSGYFDVTLGNGASTAGRNFGNTQNVLIAGNVFNDLDGDKIKDTGETGLSGWRVFVDADNDGGFDSTEKSVLTDSSGNFSFKSLAAGSYKLRVAKPSGWSLTTPITGYINVTLASGAGSTALRFGAKRV